MVDRFVSKFLVELPSPCPNIFHMASVYVGTNAPVVRWAECQDEASHYSCMLIDLHTVFIFGGRGILAMLNAVMTIQFVAAVGGLFVFMF